MSCFCECQIITRECLVENTPLTYHIDEKELLHCINEMKNLRMKDVFRSCYNTICKEINDNGLDGIDPKWVVLLNIANPAMAWLTYVEWLTLYGKSKAYRTGERRKNSDSSDNVLDQDYDEKLGDAQARANIYVNLVRNYIRDNSKEYPCYDYLSDCRFDEANDFNSIDVV